MTQTVPATCVLGPGKTGLTIGYRVLNLDGTEYSAFSTSGVAETAIAGTYRVAGGVIAPLAGGYIVWGTELLDYAEATVESAAVNVTYSAGQALSGRLAEVTDLPSEPLDATATQAAAAAALNAYDPPTNAEMEARTLAAASYATAAALDAVDNYVDTEIAAIKAKTDNLPSDPADQSAVEAAITAATSTLATAANLATLAGYVDTEVAAILAAVDTEVAAIKAKTDNLPASPAAVGSAMTLTAAYDAAKTAATQASVDDLPTNAELATALAGADDAVLAAVAALNNLSSAQAQTAAAAALAAYDPPTLAELTSAVAPLALEATAQAVLLDTGETLPALIGGLSGATVTVVSSVDGGTVTVYAADTWRFTVASDQLDLADYETLGLIVKRSARQADTQALLYLRTDTGLVRMDGAAPVGAGNGVLTKTATSFTAVVHVAETQGLVPGVYTWWLKGLDTTPAPDEAVTLATGEFVVLAAGLQAVG